MPNNLVALQIQPKLSSVVIADTDTTTSQTLFTAGASGALVDSISVTSTDSATALINLIRFDGATEFQEGQVTIEIEAGTVITNPAQNLLDSSVLPFLQAAGGLTLGPGDELRVAADVTLTAATAVTFTARGGDY